MEEWIADFRQLVEETELRLLSLSESQSSQPLAPGKWSAKQTVGHLIDSAANNHQRFVRGQFTDDLMFPGYNQEEWISSQHYDDEPWQFLLTLWKSYNLHLAHIMAATPAGVRHQPRQRHTLDKIAFNTVDSSAPATLDYLMRDYVDHLKNHLDQIFAAIGPPEEKSVNATLVG
jgi:hypothetical protein